ncbi:MAG: GDP-L-fucose synthase family protein [Flavobacteriia bacterium]|jgi:GDP-L-fucose synthase
MNKNSKLFLAGHNGMVGSALHRKLLDLGFTNVIMKSSQELNLLRQDEVERFFEKVKPDYVILAAAKVGGIKANNNFRADFIYENLMIQNNVIHAAFQNKVQKLLFLGSSCIYPKEAPQPLKESYLLTGVLESTNEPYALAKIAGIKMCENYYRQYGCNFISIMPTNMFGPNDNYDLENSHVLPALLRKFHLAKQLEIGNWDAIRSDFKNNPIKGMEENNSNSQILDYLEKIGISKNLHDQVQIQLWGSGNAFREFMFVDDFAAICLELFQKVNAEMLYDNLNETHINVGTGEEILIRDLAEMIKKIINFKGNIVWSNNDLDGTIKKRLDISLLEKLMPIEKQNLEQRITLNYQLYLNV